MKAVKAIFRLTIILYLLSFVIGIGCKQAPASDVGSVKKTGNIMIDDKKDKIDSLIEPEKALDTMDFHKKMLSLAHDSITARWPAKAPVSNHGAILPYRRVVAYYGNFYSRHMGILGTMPEDQLIKKLQKEVELWNNADTLAPVIPAIHYIAITAQKNPGKAATYRIRMPEKQILKAIQLAREIDGLTFLDVQVGHSTVSKEVPSLEQYLLEPDVHLGLDPEWSMKDGSIPGRKIGTMDARDVNFAVEYLSDLVKKHHLPPKILVVHRFTKGMLTNTDKIKTTPEVQIVINMDGFGFPAKKVDSYRRAVSAYPVQFTGFKLFYKNDIASKPYRMMTPKEILRLYPKPIYIQYQ